MKQNPIHFVSLFSRKGLSVFAVLFVGGVFPALPEIKTEELIASVPVEQVGGDALPITFEEERCRWQKDFAFFSRLMEGKNTGEEVLCSEVTKPLVSQVGKTVADTTLATTIRDLTAGYPLEVMAPAIATYDREVAGLIVGIAKKESNWGKRVPLDASGADCFNYWGWKGAGSRGVAMGHGCFGSPEEAVHAVGNRLTELVAKRDGSEPRKMIVWKCGSSCATHSPESVQKWIADVDLYYQKIVKN